MDCSLPGSSIHGIFQARVLEWGAIAFSEAGAYDHLKTCSFKRLLVVLVVVSWNLNWDFQLDYLHMAFHMAWTFL